MKLHLPKTLLAAVIAAVSFSMKAQAASTGWQNSDLFIAKGTSCDSHLNQNGMTGIKYENDIVSFESIDAIGKGDIRVQADCDNKSSMQVLIGTLTVDNDATVKVDRPYWGPRTFDALTIDNLTVDGKANLQIEYIPHSGDQSLTDEESSYVNKVVISSVTGSLGKVAVNAGGNLTIGADTSNTTFNGTITNSGTLTINGAISFKVDASSNFKMVGDGEITYSYNNENEEGFKSVAGAQYELIGENSGTINITAEQEGLTITKDETSGNVTSVIFSAAGYTDDTFRINGSNLNEATLIADTANTGVTATTKYELVAGTLTVAGDISTDRLSYSGGTLALGSNTLTIADGNTQLLLNTTGAGNVTLTANLSLAQQQATQATGKLTISNGARLNLGDSDLNASGYSVPGASISSFTAVELDDGTIYVNNPDGTINNLSVTAKGGTIDVYDLGQPAHDKWLTLAETTTLNGDLNLPAPITRRSL